VSDLLDTNAFVDHLRRGPNSNVTAKMLTARPGTIYLCSVVLGELIFGAIRSGPAMEPGNREMIADLMAQFNSSTIRRTRSGGVRATAGSLDGCWPVDRSQRHDDSRNRPGEQTHVGNPQHFRIQPRTAVGGRRLAVTNVSKEPQSATFCISTIL
jgi:hypothetical protein